MKLGKVFCLSGICSIAVALVLAHSAADARAVLSPAELDAVCGGACGSQCSESSVPGCAQEYESGECECAYDPSSGQYCPPEERRDSCNQDEHPCVDSEDPGWCTQTPATCTGSYVKYFCIRSGASGCHCVWIYGQYYPCAAIEPTTYQMCEDG